MYEQFLTQIGLTKEQSLIYEALLKNGYLTAGKIAHSINVKRGLVYKNLDELVELGLIEKKDKPGEVARFSPLHPDGLKKIIDEKNKKINIAKNSLESVFGQMLSEYNLLSGKPNVRFYEGKEGMREVLDDSLYSKTEIYSFADLETIEKFIPDVNKDYVAKRKKFDIKKRGILPDTPFNREVLSKYDMDVTDAKLVKLNVPIFETIMQIYDNKISYLTLREAHMVGIIIEDEHIYLMHKNYFEHLWNITPAFKSA